MTIPDEIRKCVAFVGFQLADGSTQLAGTVFFVSREMEGVKDRTFSYAVTAKHVIEGIGRKGLSTLLLRLNTAAGRAIWATSRLHSWHFHPDDPSVDVAVARFYLDEKLDHLCCPLALAATPDIVAREQIGVGHEVCLAGLFSPHHGRERNIPIVRVGNIAAMPREKVNTKVGDMDAYLIEARSVGGLGGSPVFVHAGYIRHADVSAAPQLFLLGLMHGHFDVKSLRKGATEDALDADAINMGIGIVIPVDKIMQVINQPAFRNFEAPMEESLRKSSLPADGGADGPRSFTCSEVPVLAP